MGPPFDTGVQVSGLYNWCDLKDIEPGDDLWIDFKRGESAGDFQIEVCDVSVLDLDCGGCANPPTVFRVTIAGIPDLGECSWNGAYGLARQAQTFPDTCNWRWWQDQAILSGLNLSIIDGGADTEIRLNATFGIFDVIGAPLLCRCHMTFGLIVPSPLDCSTINGWNLPLLSDDPTNDCDTTNATATISVEQ